jgi:RNA recognition motif-containing protein
MLYDYDALVAKINYSRERNDWQTSVDGFSELSIHCPMTPLLWIQYAHDTYQVLSEESNIDALNVRLDVLTLGLSEFPGCALLQLHYLELKLQHLEFAHNSEAVIAVKQAFHDALSAVGQGSHRNEDLLVVQIYRLYVSFVAKYLAQEDMLNIFVQRAKVPMVVSNDGILNEIEEFAEKHNLVVSPEICGEVEKSRRYVAIWFQSLQVFEDDIDESMMKDQILPRYNIQLENVDWESILSIRNGSFWMGLGGKQSAQSFIRYAQACVRFKGPHRKHKQKINDDDQNSLRKIHNLVIPIYERGISECPTVEDIWSSYMKSLSWLILKGNRIDLSSFLESVAERASRNCPFSLKLAEARIEVNLTLAAVNYTTLSYQSLLAIVRRILDTDFLPEQSHHFRLYMKAIQTVKERILFLLIPDYDEPHKSEIVEYCSTKNPSKHVDDEIQNLIEGLRELYIATIDNFHKKQWSDSRRLVCTDQCITELYLLTPLINLSQVPPGSSALNFKEISQYADDLISVQSHPDSFRVASQMFLAFTATSPQEVAYKFRLMRKYFQEGLNSLKTLYQDMTALYSMRFLCQEYRNFEEHFGSEKSLRIAKRLIDKSLSDTNISCGAMQSNTNMKETQNSLHIDESSRTAENIVSHEENSSGKNQVLEKDTIEGKATSSPMGVFPPSGSEVEKNDKKAKDIPKVKLGHLEYPAHPLTVRVSNLSPETEDMDLVNVFRPKCGGVVHARVIRERHPDHGLGKSKGWGLIQFEYEDSVEKAVALHDVIGLHERVVKVSRSHIPAVSITPQRMERSNIKKKRKASISATDVCLESNDLPSSEQKSTALNEEAKKSSKENEKSSSSTAVGLLSFQPRVMLRRKQRVEV